MDCFVIMRKKGRPEKMRGRIVHKYDGTKKEMGIGR